MTLAPSPNSPASSRSDTFELPHRLTSGEQTFRGVVGRHFDQRAVQLDPRLAGGAGGFERGYDIARATKLVAIRSENAIDDAGMRRIDEALGRVAQATRPACVTLDAGNVAPGVGAIDRDDACRDAFDDKALPAVGELDAVNPPLGAEIGGKVFRRQQASRGSLAD